LRNDLFSNYVQSVLLIHLHNGLDAMPLAESGVND